MTTEEPDWNSPLLFSLTPDAIINSIFTTAEEVHTGWETCVNAALIMSETTAVDAGTGNHCRLAEQEFSYDDEPDAIWHDWSVELRIGETYILAHWRVMVNETPAMWTWASNEAENAFIAACVLIGQRVRRTLAVENASAVQTPTPPRSRHH
jgi:hypothetical protein